MHRNPLMGLLLAGSLALTLLACKKPDAAAEKSDSPISSLSIGAEDILEIGSSEHGTGPVITGSLQPERRADLRAEVASIVIKMHKENGEPVRQGDLLVSLDSAVLRDNLSSAEEAVRAAAQSLDSAERQYQRLCKARGWCLCKAWKNLKYAATLLKASMWPAKPVWPLPNSS